MKAFLFSESLAITYGVNAAILYENFCRSVNFNKCSKINIFNGIAYEKASIESLCNTFKFLSKYQIIKALKTLEDAELIFSRKSPKDKFDKTKYYAVEKEVF